MNAIVGIVMTAALLLRAPGCPQEPPGPVSFAGSLQDAKGAALQGATVTLDGGQWSAVTDGKGDFVFESVPMGEHVLEVTNGEAAASRTIVLARSGSASFAAGWVRLTSGALSIDLPDEADRLDTQIKMLGEDLSFGITDLSAPGDRSFDWLSLWPIYLAAALVISALVWKGRKDGREH